MIMKSDTLLREAKNLMATGHPAESIEYFNNLMDEGCNPVTVYLNRGVAYVSLAKFPEAVDDFTSVLEVDHDNERALYYRGVARMNLGRFEEAIEDLDRAIAVNQERGSAFLARGLALAELGREDEALRDFKTASILSNIEVEGFLNQFGANRTMFDKSMALLEGERGPWKYVLSPAESGKIEEWRH
jgi:tetratricopeptide (TPR) repeat protein